MIWNISGIDGSQSIVAASFRCSYDLLLLDSREGNSIIPTGSLSYSPSYWVFKYFIKKKRKSKNSNVSDKIFPQELEKML